MITRTLESLPDDATYWISRGMAHASGLSTSTVQRIWRAFGFQLHREGTFKLSTDPGFVDKVRDVVGLYVSPVGGACLLSPRRPPGYGFERTLGQEIFYAPLRPS